MMWNFQQIKISKEKHCRLACIMRNPPEDDDEEQTINSTLSVAAIEGPPVDETTPNWEQDRNRF